MSALSEDRENPRGQRGRGRLSSIDMLPEAADEAIAWANAQLRERAMPQTEIMRQFNAMLADHGIPPVSVGAFSRWSIRIAIETRKIEASRQITSAVLSRLPKGERSDATIAAIELVKYRLVELITSQEEVDLGLLKEASLTLMRLSSTEQRAAEGQRRAAKDERDQADRDAEKAEADRQKETEETAATVERFASEAGLSADRVAAIRKGVLGLAG